MTANVTVKRAGNGNAPAQMHVAARPQVKTKTPPKPHSKPAVPTISPLQTLLALESETFSAKDRLSLKHMAVNKPRTLIKTGHIFFIKKLGPKFEIIAISNQSGVEKNAPFVQWLTRSLGNAVKTLDLSTPQRFSLADIQRKNEAFDYPFLQALWAPFAPDPNSGGLLYTREPVWEETDMAIPVRLGQIYGIQWAALGRKKRTQLNPKKRLIMGASALLLGVMSCIPVPVTTLAHAEIVSQSPYIVSAPMDGVIAELLALPNSYVQKGDILARFEDTTHRNELNLASEELDVTRARLRQAGLSAFVDETTKREIALAEAERNLAQTRLDYAQDLLSKTELRAEQSGLLLYSDVKDWMGRPVATGERIMEIADSKAVQIRLEASIHDSAALQDNTRVRLFLDSDPLNPQEAKLTRASFYATPQAGGELAYEAYAKFNEQDFAPRIGARGVAKIYGQSAPLGYWLLRRPLTSARQFLGL